MSGASVAGARESGAALLVALAIVAVAAGLAVAMSAGAGRDVERTRALFQSEQSWQLARGLDGLAREWIRANREAGRADTALDGRWSAPFAVPGGQVAGRVFIVDGRLNLNALASRRPEVAAWGRASLARLLASLNLDARLAPGIENFVRRAAADGGPGLVHVTELAGLPELPGAAREALIPHVAALPHPDARLNVNAATPHALAAAVDGLTVSGAAALLARTPYEDLDALMGRPEMSRLDARRARERLGVRAEWFLGQARVTLDGVPRDHFRLIGQAGAGYDFRYVSQGVP
ncbi:MAG: type II secretion system minor pseudopilin GspK [Wenzhouxiangellaceae bacterium]|nr:type II secretion system minor pseudopilin GspK [Wenzhouxiangellaceae bacterium]